MITNQFPKKNFLQSGWDLSYAGPKKTAMFYAHLQNTKGDDFILHKNFEPLIMAAQPVYPYKSHCFLFQRLRKLTLSEGFDLLFSEMIGQGQTVHNQMRNRIMEDFTAPDMQYETIFGGSPFIYQGCVIWWS